MISQALNLQMNIVIRLLKKSHDWVSRGGIKLSYALDKLNLNLEDRVCADLGSSTGGFTDVLLKKMQSIYIVLMWAKVY